MINDNCLAFSGSWGSWAGRGTVGLVIKEGVNAKSVLPLDSNTYNIPKTANVKHVEQTSEPWGRYAKHTYFATFVIRLNMEINFEDTQSRHVCSYVSNVKAKETRNPIWIKFPQMTNFYDKLYMSINQRLMNFWYEIKVDWGWAEWKEIQLSFYAAVLFFCSGSVQRIPSPINSCPRNCFASHASQ